MQAKLSEQLSPTDAKVILERLPKRIEVALMAHATEIDYPIEAVIEIAIASFLDAEAWEALLNESKLKDSLFIINVFLHWCG